MISHPFIDPVALSIGTLQIHWYGLMYLLAFITAWWLGRLRADRYGWTKAEVEDVLFYGALGVIIGGRLGYVVFYGLPHTLSHPLNVVKVWQGGMSFHGGLIGVLVAFWLFARRSGKHYFAVSDFIAPMVPIGLFFGRIGNFINGELWGKASSLPWAIVFPAAGNMPRHPSMLYQAALEGLLLFIILWWYSLKPKPLAAVSGLFLIGYGLLRFIVEFVRVPDEQYGYLALNWLTMGQVLSLPMIIAGIFITINAHQHQHLQ